MKLFAINKDIKPEAMQSDHICSAIQRLSGDGRLIHLAIKHLDVISV